MKYVFVTILLLAGSANAQQSVEHDIHLGRSATPEEHQLELLKMRVEQLEKYSQNNMGAHPDTRPGRSHAGTLPYAEHGQKLAKCMIDLTTIPDPDLRRWCEAQSRKLP